MDERDQKRQLIDAQAEGTGRLRGGVERVRVGLDQARGRVDADGAREAVEDARWFLRQHVAWPIEDGLDRLGRRGAIGVFGGGGIAVVGVVAALVIAASGGSGQRAGTTEAFVTPQRSPIPVPAAVVPAPKPTVKRATKPTGPTLHGAPPDFAPAQDVRSGVADGTAVGGMRSGSATGGVPASRGAGNGSKATDGAATGEAVTSANDTPASTAKIGATPEAIASAQARASKAATASDAGVAETGGDQSGARTSSNAGAGNAGRAGGDANEGEPSGPPAPKAAKRVARRFAEAFVVYEIGGTDAKVREAFGQTSTRQLSRSLLHRPPRQPASVKVPRAKVVNVVAGPSKGSVYTVSVSLLRVGVTSELRLEMEQGVGKKWQVTNVLG